MNKKDGDLDVKDGQNLNRPHQQAKLSGNEFHYSPYKTVSQLTQHPITSWNRRLRMQTRLESQEEDLTDHIKFNRI